MIGFRLLKNLLLFLILLGVEEGYLFGGGSTHIILDVCYITLDNITLMLSKLL
jgi:hypothetical protein